jgi:hypothetical protein
MNYDTYGNDGQAAGLFLLFFGLFYGFIFLLLIAFYVVNSFAFMSFFRKVGIKPWIAWVPIYNNWVRLEVGGQKGWFSLFSLVNPGGIVTLIFIGIGAHRTGIAFRKDSGYVALAILLPFVWAFILGGKSVAYEPALITAAGYPPPLAGFGSVVPNFANADHQAPPAAPAV